MTYAPTLESLNAHPVPQWYDDAKFGIFIHWGLFSIPAFASKSGSISDAFKNQYDIAVAQTPYCEWYWNSTQGAGERQREISTPPPTTTRPTKIFAKPFLEGLKPVVARGLGAHLSPMPAPAMWCW